MKLIRVSLLAGLIVLAATACRRAEAPTTSNSPAATTATPATTPDEFAAARLIFARDCVNCHMSKGEGGTVTVDEKKLKVPSLLEGHALKHTDADFVDQIMKGGDGMPEFKDKLKPEEIDALVRFIRHEFQGQP
jgi:mono/diheme cytochrome c family protein